MAEGAHGGGITLDGDLDARAFRFADGAAGGAAQIAEKLIFILREIEGVREVGCGRLSIGPEWCTAAELNALPTSLAALACQATSCVLETFGVSCRRDACTSKRRDRQSRGFIGLFARPRSFRCPRADLFPNPACDPANECGNSH